MIRRLFQQFQKPFVVWFLIFLFGFIYLMTGIGHEAFWYDEVYSASIINYSIPEILKLLAYDQHPPLYYIMLKLISLIFGSSESSLRFLSVLGALAFMSLGLGPVRRIYGNFTGFIFSFIVLAAPMTLSMAQEARMYTWSVFFVTGSVIYGYLGIKDNKLWDWIRFVLLTLASAYTHYFALLAVTIANILMFVWIIFLKREIFGHYILAAFVALIGFLPCMLIFLNQASMTSKDFWVPPVDIYVIGEALIYPFRAQFDKTPLSLVCFISTVILTVFGFVLAKKNKESIALPAFAILTYSLTILSAVLISNVIRPIFYERYIFPSIGLLLLAAVFGISKIRNKKASIILLIAFAILSFPQVFRIMTEKFHGPMREVTATLKPDVKKDDVFIHTVGLTFGTFSYYFPENKHILYMPYVPINRCLVFKKNGIITTDFSEAIKNYKNIWIVDQVDGKYSSEFYGWYDSGFLKKTKEPINFQTKSWFKFSVVPVKIGNMKSDLPFSEGTGSIKIKIKNLNNKSGNLLVMLYRKADLLFQSNGELETRGIIDRKTIEIKDTKTETVFYNLPFDYYGVLALHDQNKNGEIDYEYCSGKYVPKEGIGMTNGMGKFMRGGIPTFEMGKFRLETDEVKKDLNIVYWN